MATKRRTPPADVPLARELEMQVDNTESLYRQKRAMQTTVAKHLCRGGFSSAKAVIGFRHVIDAAIPSYVRDTYMLPSEINAATKNLAAAALADEFKALAKSCLLKGQCGDLAPETVKVLERGTVMGSKARACRPKGEMASHLDLRGARKRKRRR